MRKSLLAIAGVALVLAGLTAIEPLRVWAYQTAKGLAADGSVAQSRWDSSSLPITWQMDPTVAANISGAGTGRQQQDVLTLAFSQWTSAVPVTMQQGSAPPAGTKAAQLDGINLITSNTGPTDLPSGVLAYTYVFAVNSAGPIGGDPQNRTAKYAGQIVEADMAFSSSSSVPYSLSATTPSSSVDFQSVATHEAGHFFGMDHASNVSSTMFWAQSPGNNYERTISSDDIAGISTIYPPASFAQKGTLNGKVKTTAGAAVFGAIVVAVDSNGVPVASAMTDPNGNYSIQGLAAGSYTVYAEPLTGRIGPTNIYSLAAYPNATVNTNFTTRYH